MDNAITAALALAAVVVGLAILGIVIEVGVQIVERMRDR